MEIEKHWADLRAVYSEDKLAASRPRATRTLGRAVVPRLSLAVLPRLRARRWRGARYLLRTDIAQFYRSLYTHSIPWALHTKSVAKANKFSPLSGNLLDKASQALQWGQTAGIPIGPDTSLVLAEALLCRVGKRLEQDLGPLRGFRYLDDYELPFRRLHEAESALERIQGLLAEFELALNPKKTGIEELPRAIDVGWHHELARFEFRPGPRKVMTDLIILFSRAFEIAHNYPEDAVLRYAVMKTRGLSVPSTGWRTFEGLVLSTISVEPSVLPVAIAVTVEAANAGGHSVSKTGWRETLESVIERHAPLGHGSEVAWALWAANVFDVGLGSQVSALVSAIEDDVVALLALDLEQRGLLTLGSVEKQRIAAPALLPGALESEHWLLAYEGHIKGWLHCPTLAADPNFSGLAAAGVSFYNKAASTTAFPAAASTTPGGGSFLPSF